ncbi:MAG TPA: universal stress protein [Thermoanaerobaculia bacterium]|nr:universal stress protein [Thermoanaerobaculia bacterium]
MAANEAGSAPRRLRHVLAATDFSATAAAAVDWGVDLARRHGATLHLVHGVTLPVPMAEYVPSSADVDREICEGARSRLEEVARGLEATGVTLELHLPTGVPSQVIARTAEEVGADLVVIGTQGLSGLAHLLLGSTAQRVVQHAPCPVLTVHQGDRERHRPVRTLLAATDFSTGADEAVRTALDLFAGSGEAPTRLVLLHAYHLPMELTAYGPVPTSVHYYQDAGADAQERLDLAAAALGRDGWAVETRVRQGFAPEVIVAEAEELDADLVALGTHGRTGLAHLLLGSTAERVVQHAPCPVMTVRRPRD